MSIIYILKYVFQPDFHFSRRSPFFWQYTSTYFQAAILQTLFHNAIWLKLYLYVMLFAVLCMYKYMNILYSLSCSWYLTCLSLWKPHTPPEAFLSVRSSHDGMIHLRVIVGEINLSRAGTVYMRNQILSSPCLHSVRPSADPMLTMNFVLFMVSFFYFWIIVALRHHINWVNIGSGNGLLHGGIKSLPKPI